MPNDYDYNLEIGARMVFLFNNTIMKINDTLIPCLAHPYGNQIAHNDLELKRAKMVVFGGLEVVPRLVRVIEMITYDL